MNDVIKRYRYTLSLLAVAVVVGLSGCTDGMLGPEDPAATDSRTLEQVAPLDGFEQPDLQGRLAHRYFMPLPPDSVGTSDSTSVPAPTGRVTGRYEPIILPPPKDSTSTPPPPPPPPIGSGTNGGGS